MHASCYVCEFDDTARSVWGHPPTFLHSDTVGMIHHFHGEACPYEIMRRSPQTVDF